MRFTNGRPHRCHPPPPRPPPPQTPRHSTGGPAPVLMPGPEGLLTRRCVETVPPLGVSDAQHPAWPMAGRPHQAPSQTTVPAHTAAWVAPLTILSPCIHSSAADVWRRRRRRRSAPSSISGSRAATPRVRRGRGRDDSHEVPPTPSDAGESRGTSVMAGGGSPYTPSLTYRGDASAPPTPLLVERLRQSIAVRSPSTSDTRLARVHVRRRAKRAATSRRLPLSRSLAGLEEGQAYRRRSHTTGGVRSGAGGAEPGAAGREPRAPRRCHLEAWPSGCAASAFFARAHSLLAIVRRGRRTHRPPPSSCALAALWRALVDTGPVSNSDAGGCACVSIVGFGRFAHSLFRTRTWGRRVASRQRRRRRRRRRRRVRWARLQPRRLRPPWQRRWRLAGTRTPTSPARRQSAGSRPQLLGAEKHT
jgi:hypothetical protein